MPAPTSLFHSLATAALFLPLALSIDYGSIDYSGPYFAIDNGDALTSERSDPIMGYGQIPSNHVHDIFGGDAFSATWDYTKAQTSQCNTMGIKADHSNYWYPALFLKQQGEYVKMKSQLKVYYHYDLVDGEARTMFPEGMKIIAGNAMNRHDDTATNPATASIRWICHGPLTNGQETPGAAGGMLVDDTKHGKFPTGFEQCTDKYNGFSVEIWFPFCWDGVNEFDPKEPNKHVMYPPDSNKGNGGSCSKTGTHTKTLPQLFMEFHHDVSEYKWSADENPWVLAMGDDTGYGMHADFINGWESRTTSGSLPHAIAANGASTNCNVGESGRDIFASCFDKISNKCTYTPQVKESVTNGTALPGCNPIQHGPADAVLQTGAKCEGAGSVAPGSDTGTDAASATMSKAVVPSPSATGKSKRRHHHKQAHKV